MKKVFFSLLSVLFAMTAQAQLAAGDYVIQNVETGFYLGGGNDWGTHASLIGRPQVFTLAGSGNVYTLDSHQSNGGEKHYLGTGLYVDAKSADWTFTATATEGVYTINNAGNYLAGAEKGNVITTTTESSSASAQWRLISTASIETAMNSAAFNAPVDVTYLIIPEIKRNALSRWSITDFGGGGKPNNSMPKASDLGYNYGINCAESYHSSNGFKFTQSVSTLRAGVYALGAQAFYRQDGSDTRMPYLFVGDVKSNFPLKTGTENSHGAAYTSFINRTYPVTPIFFVVEEDGSATFGFAGRSTTMWHAFGELDLKYYGNSAEAKYGAALATAQLWAAENQVDVYTSVKTRLNEALSTYSRENVETAEATDESYNAAATALNAISAEVAESNSLIQAYQDALYQAKNVNQEQAMDKDVLVALQNAINQSPTEETYAEVTATLNQAKAAADKSIKKYVNAQTRKSQYLARAAAVGLTLNTEAFDAAYNARTLSNETEELFSSLMTQIDQVIGFYDATSTVINPSFEETERTSGWTLTEFGGASDNKKFGQLDRNIFVEKWTWGSNLGDGTISQLVGLPAGKYILTAKAQLLWQMDADRIPGGMYIFAGDDKVEVTNQSGTYAVAFELVRDEHITIGAKLESCTGNWACVDNFVIRKLDESKLTTVAGKMGAAEETAQNEAYTAYQGNSGLENIAALITAVAAARQSVAFYAKVTPWVEIYNNLDASGKAALQTATNDYVTNYNNGTLNEEETELNNTIIPDIRIGVKAQTTEGSDFTGAIINPNFDGNINGWTDTFTGSLNHGFQNNASYGTINQFMECWAGYWSGAPAPYLLPDGRLYQTITDLPAGEYTLSADIIAEQQQVGQDGYIASLDEVTGIYIFAESNVLFTSEACNKTSDAADKNISFTFNTSAGNTAVGLLIKSTNCNWAVIDNVRLVYNGPSSINIYQTALKEAVAKAPDYTDADCKSSLKQAYIQALDEATETSNTDNLTDEQYKTTTDNLTQAQNAVEISIASYANSKALRAAVEAGQAYAFEDPFAGWSLDHEDPNFHKNTWSVEGDSDGSNMQKPFGEYWTNDAALADGIIRYNTLGGMKAGKYAVSMLVRIYDNDNSAYDGVSFNNQDITTGLTHVKCKDPYGELLNGVYGVITSIVNVAEEEGDLNFQLKVKNANASWLAWKGLTIKYLGQEETDAAASLKITEAGYATYYAPFVTQIPEGVQVYTVTGVEENGYTLTLSELTGAIPANTPVLLEGAAQTVENTGVAYSTVNCGPTIGLLTGVLEKTEATVGTYILQNKNGKVGFYHVANTGLYVGANRAYLTAPATQEVKAFFFDEATAIEAMEALTSGKADIYDLNGRRLQKLQKGINIVNGVKILVK